MIYSTGPTAFNCRITCSAIRNIICFLWYYWTPLHPYLPPRNILGEFLDKPLTQYRNLNLDFCLVFMEIKIASKILKIYEFLDILNIIQITNVPDSGNHLIIHNHGKSFDSKHRVCQNLIKSLSLTLFWLIFQHFIY